MARKMTLEEAREIDMKIMRHHDTSFITDKDYEEAQKILQKEWERKNRGRRYLKKVI